MLGVGLSAKDFCADYKPSEFRVLGVVSSAMPFTQEHRRYAAAVQVNAGAAGRVICWKTLVSPCRIGHTLAKR